MTPSVQVNTLNSRQLVFFLHLLKICLSTSLSFLKTRELSRMLVGISNMAERCYMKHYGPLGEMTFQSKLDMIEVGKSVCASKIKLAQNRYRIYWMKCKSKGKEHLFIHSNYWCHSVTSKLLLFFHSWADPTFNALIPLHKLFPRPFHNSCWVHKGLFMLPNFHA